MQHVASFLVPADRLDKTDGPKFFAWGQRRKVPSSDRLILGSLVSCLGVHLSDCQGLLLSPIISRPVKWEFCTWGLEWNNQPNNEIFLFVYKKRETTPNMLKCIVYVQNQMEEALKKALHSNTTNNTITFSPIKRSEFLEGCDLMV